ncbi:MAG: bifunctional diaminohydroxyphosphoribosylaminopyrimidine deaminase/5-amino-6-(5-phosphoribosylamino)uracil reductase RibD [Candidatus Anstonellaceae archaeon]
MNNKIIQKKLDAQYIRQTFALAKKANPYPNPKVGAIIVKNGKIIGKGYHKKAGLAHAEVEAINSVKKKYRNYKKILEGSTLYVNLEPCNHYGRTPPCTLEIIKNKIKRVVFSNYDYNKMVRGNGSRFLKKNGIEVVGGILQKEGFKINKIYFREQKRKNVMLPEVILKLAISLDGKIATSTYRSKWISSLQSRKIVQKLRKKADAILIGLNTLKKDNPTLKILNSKKQPLRVIVSYNLESIKGNEKIFFDKNVLIAYCKAKKNTEEKLIKKAKLLKCPSKNKKVDLKFLLNYLKKNGFNNILCEGGARVATSLIKEGLIWKIILFYCPIIIGEDGINMVEKLNIKNILKAIRFKIEKIKRIGPDLMIILKMDKKTKTKN